MTLEQKELQAIELLRHGANLATELNPSGYWVGFSGGKDSQVLLDLVRRSGVPYTAHYNVTSIDPPDNVYFIRKHYPEVEFLHPEENFFKLVEKKGLPSVTRRWCCERLKERSSPGNVILTGVRAEESLKRAKYEQVQIRSRRKENQHSNGRTIDNIMQAQHRCIKGKDSIMIFPLLNWTSQDIWNYIHQHDLPMNPCYLKNNRVGCMFCPFASRKTILTYCQQYPSFYKLLLKSLAIYINNTPSNVNRLLNNAEDVFKWWLTGDTAQKYIQDKRQLNLDL